MLDVSELVMLGEDGTLVRRSILHQSIENLELDDGESDREHELITVELGFALRLIHREGKELVQVEVRALNDDVVLILDVELHIFELGIWQPDFDQQCVAVVRRGIPIRQTKEDILGTHVLLWNNLKVRYQAVVRHLFCLLLNFLRGPDHIFGVL